MKYFKKRPDICKPNIIWKMEEFSQELYDKARASVREGYCDYGDAETEEATSEECSECYEECLECADECCF